MRESPFYAWFLVSEPHYNSSQKKNRSYDPLGVVLETVRFKDDLKSAGLRYCS